MPPGKLASAQAAAAAFLEGQLSSVATNPYALAIISYALTVAGSKKSSDALEQLNKLAIIKGWFQTFNCK